MKWRRVHGVLISDYEALLKTGMDLSLLGSAIDDAKKTKREFGWASSGDKLVTAILDEQRNRLLMAELYFKESSYRDPKEVKQD